MKHLFILTFLLFSFGQLSRISFFGQQINGYLYELGILGILGILGRKYKTKPIREVFFHFRIVFLLFLSLLVSFILGLGKFTLFQNAVSFLYFLRLLLYFGFFFYLIYHLKKNLRFKQVLGKGLSIFILFTIFTSLTQYILYPNLRNLLYAGWDPHQFRLYGLFFDTSLAGAVYGILFLYFFLKRHYFGAAIFLIFIVLTFSRSLYVAILIVTILIAIEQKWYRQLFLLIGAFLLLILIVPKPSGEGVNLLRLFSIQSRRNDYRVAIKIWQKNPLFGIGYNRIRYVKRQMNVVEEVGSDVNHSGASFHSSFLIMLVAGGILGVLGFLGVIYKFFKFSNIIAYYVTFLGLLSLADNILLHPFILFLFLLMTAYSVSPSRISR